MNASPHRDHVDGPHLASSRPHGEADLSGAAGEVQKRPRQPSAPQRRTRSSIRSSWYGMRKVVVTGVPRYRSRSNAGPLPAAPTGLPHRLPEALRVLDPRQVPGLRQGPPGAPAAAPAPGESTAERGRMSRAPRRRSSTGTVELLAGGIQLRGAPGPFSVSALKALLHSVLMSNQGSAIRPACSSVPLAVHELGGPPQHRTLPLRRLGASGTARQLAPAGEAFGHARRAGRGGSPGSRRASRSRDRCRCRRRRSGEPYAVGVFEGVPQGEHGDPRSGRAGRCGAASTCVRTASTSAYELGDVVYGPALSFGSGRSRAGPTGRPVRPQPRSSSATSSK